MSTKIRFFERESAKASSISVDRFSLLKLSPEISILETLKYPERKIRYASPIEASEAVITVKFLSNFLFFLRLRLLLNLMLSDCLLVPNRFFGFSLERKPRVGRYLFTLLFFLFRF